MWSLGLILLFFMADITISLHVELISLLFSWLVIETDHIVLLVSSGYMTDFICVTIVLVPVCCLSCINVLWLVYGAQYISQRESVSGRMMQIFSVMVACRGMPTHPLLRVINGWQSNGKITSLWQPGSLWVKASEAAIMQAPNQPWAQGQARGSTTRNARPLPTKHV
jgi:hypothetical protein